MPKFKLCEYHQTSIVAINCQQDEGGRPAYDLRSC